MTKITARKLSANRANASKSTGPRSSAGRARSCRNALRHGLSTPIYCDPTWKERSQAIFNEIADLFSSEEDKLAIARIAERQCEILRVRQARQAALDQSFSKQRHGPSVVTILGIRRCKWMIKMQLVKGASIREIDEFLAPKPLPDAANQSASIKEVVDQINKFDRYERRATSTLRTAMQRLRSKQD